MVNKYYQKHKERLQRETLERHQNLSEKEKEKRQKRSETDKNLPEEKSKNYVSIWKNII